MNDRLLRFSLVLVLALVMTPEASAFLAFIDKHTAVIETDKQTENGYHDGQLAAVTGGKMMNLSTNISNGPLEAKLSITDLGKLGSLKLLLEITNGSDNAIEVHFTSGMDADLALIQAGGEQIWSWSQDMMFTQALSQTLLKPGGVENYRFEVPASVLLDCRPPCELEARFMGTTSNGTPLLPVLRLPLQ